MNECQSCQEELRNKKTTYICVGCGDKLCTHCTYFCESGVELCPECTSGGMDYENLDYY